METIIVILMSIVVGTLIYLRGYKKGYAEGLNDVIEKVGSIKEKLRILEELKEEKMK